MALAARVARLDSAAMTIGVLAGHPANRIPPSHLDLAECPPVAALTTLMRDGAPQTSVVWCDLEGDLVRVNTMRGFAKERNMRRDPRVTLLCYDPRQSLRYLEVRGTVVAMTEDGAGRHLDEIASKYAGRPIRYFGECIPASFAATEIPVLCRIRPDRVVALDATGGTPAASSPDPTSPEPTSPGPVSAAPGPDAPDAIPATHRDLLERPICAVLTTLGPGGHPESSLVWASFDGECATVNTTLERRKGRNLVRDPRLSLLVVDPANTGRFLQVRGDAELVTDGAEADLDAVTRAYTSHPRYYGYVYPEAQRARETRVIVRVRPRRITRDAIHA